MQSSTTETTTADGANRPRVTLTPAAVAWVKTRREKLGQPEAALRVGVKGGGCAGYSYVTELTEEAPKSRELVYDFDGVRVFVDERSLDFIDGSVIDAKTTLMYQGLKFDNPLEEKSCGCGATFSVKQRD
ncbi:MAG: iron-sulfur cluster assembly accessory protein [Polyangiaceae bacterium]